MIIPLRKEFKNQKIFLDRLEETKMFDFYYDKEINELFVIHKSKKGKNPFILDFYINSNVSVRNAGYNGFKVVLLFLELSFETYHLPLFILYDDNNETTTSKKIIIYLEHLKILQNLNFSKLVKHYLKKDIEIYYKSIEVIEDNSNYTKIINKINNEKKDCDKKNHIYKINKIIFEKEINENNFKCLKTIL